MTVGASDGLVKMRPPGLVNLLALLVAFRLLAAGHGCPMKDIFVFDLDGTLIDTKKVTSQVLDDMVLARGGAPDDHEVTNAVLSHGVLEIVGDICRRFGGEPQDYLLEFRERVADVHVSFSLVFPGVIELLEAAIASGACLAVNTNKPTELARKALEDTTLLPYFTVVQGADEALNKKPALDHMNVICHELNSAFEDMVFFGDSEVDQETAHNANMDYVHFLFGYGDLRSELTPPRLTFNALCERVIDEIVTVFRTTSA